MNNYIMWDFDHTLAYRDGMWTKTIYDLIVENNNYEIDIEKIRIITKNGFPWHNADISHQDLMQNLSWWDYLKTYFIKELMILGIDVQNATSISNGIQEKYLDLEHWALFSDTKSALKALLDKGYKHLILSNHVPELPSLVESLNISKYFNYIFTSGIIGYEKPHQITYNYALKSIPSKSKVIMIGDNYQADVLGAHKVGLDAIHVRKPHIDNYKYYSKSFDESFINMVECLFEEECKM